MTINSPNYAIKDILSRNRSFLMGIAILIIAIYHIPLKTSISGLEFLQSIGYCGADMFIMLSGFGAFYSLQKNDDAFSFLKRRAIRLIPSYLPFIVVWMIVHKFLLRLYFTEICGNLSMLGWWNGDENQLNWYIDCIVVFYVIAPYIYKAIITSKNRMLAIVALTCFSLIVGVAFFHGQLIIAVSRLPIFIIGFAFAAIDNFLTCGKSAVIIWNIAMIIGLTIMYILLHQQAVDLWHYGLYWYPFTIIIPGLSIDLSFISELIKGKKGVSLVQRTISSLGDASFEIFLIHLFIFENFMLISTTNWLGWSAMLIASLILGYGYYVLIGKFKLKY